VNGAREGALVHHELCFGCGQTNLFGLLLEVTREEPDLVTGRCFIKQDHQGADRGHAHEGIVATALSEAMALAAGAQARPQAVTVGFIDRAPVGAFLEVEARIEEREGEDVFTLTATAKSEQRIVARARGTYSRS
jgi:acyl-coenzyme A thioesterase PaaI-like protein